MVQISTSTVVVAVLAASTLAAPAPYDNEFSLSAREPEPIKGLGAAASGVRSAISNQMGKLKGAVKGLRKDEGRQKNRLANDIKSGNFQDAQRAEGAISRDKAGIRKDKGRENTLRTAAQDLGARDFDDEEFFELVARDPPTVPKKPTSSPARSSKRKGVSQVKIDAAIKSENNVLKGKARNDKQALRKEKASLESDISKGNFAAAVKDEQAIQGTRADLGTVRKNEATLKQIENTYGRREFDDEFELEAREFDDFEYELVRRDPPKKVATTPKKKSTTTRPRKTASQTKIDAAVGAENKVLRGKARNDRQAIRKEKSDLAGDISRGNFAAVAKDEQAIKNSKSDLSTVRKNEATLQQIENTYGRRDFDDEFELEARDFDDEYELEARDFDELEERGFDEYELEMLD